MSIRSKLLTLLYLFAALSMSPNASSESWGSYEWINPSKLIGEWRVVFMKGLDEDFLEVEEEFINNDQRLIWDTALPETPLLSYSYLPEENISAVIVRGCNEYTTHFKGNLFFDINNVQFIGALPSTEKKCTSLVKDISGKIVSTGPNPIDVIFEKYLVHSINANRTEVLELSLIHI